jgi:hypothetical protein
MSIPQRAASLRVTQVPDASFPEPRYATSPGGLPAAKDTIVVVAPLPVRQRIRWGWVCGMWFVLVLLYGMAGSKRVPAEEVPALVERTQILMGIAVFPAIVRLWYRRLFS